MRAALAHLRQRLEPAGLAPAEALALLVLLACALALTATVWWANAHQPAPPDAATGGSEDPAGAAGAAPAGLPDGGAPSGPAGAPGPAPPPGGGSGSDAAGPVLVHVAGHVASPGVVQLPAGSRVADAVAAAGGATPDAELDAVNLARQVVDGEQVRVPGPGEAPPPTGAAPAGPATGGDAGAGGAAAGPISLNAATAADLEALPGIGPVMAERIVAHRDAVGGFADVTQLLEVPGIGPARFAELEPRVRL